MAHAFVLGVDFDGDEASGDAVLTLIEKEKNPDDHAAQYRLDRVRRRDGPFDADALADRIQSLVAERPYIGRTSIVVNRRSDTGQALVDALQARGLDPVAATLASGRVATAGDRGEVGVRLGVTDAVQTLVSLYREGRLVIEEHNTDAASHLARELQRTLEVFDEADDDRRAETDAIHPPDLDDIDSHVTSAALAAWLGTERSFDPSQHLKQTPQTTSRTQNG